MVWLVCKVHTHYFACCMPVAGSVYVPKDRCANRALEEEKEKKKCRFIFSRINNREHWKNASNTVYTFALTDQSHIARHCAKYAVVMGASSQFLTLFHPKQALHWSQTNALFTQHLKKPGLGCITLPIRPGTNQWKLLYTDRDTLKRFLLIFLNSTNLLNILNTDREPFSFIVLRSRQFGLFVCICVWLCFSPLSTTTDYPTSLTGDAVTCILTNFSLLIHTRCGLP